MIRDHSPRRASAALAAVLTERARSRCRSRLARFLALGVLLVGGLASTSAAAWEQENEVPVNQGGVLIVHDHGPVPRGSIAGCDLLTLEDPTHAKVEMDVDPEPHLIGVYAVFAPGDSVLLAGVTFGIHFPETVSIIASGACSNNGVLIVPPDWPSDRQGVASAVLPPQTSSVVPIYWFYILANEPGFFELTPHPVPRHGGAFGSGDPAPRLTPITGYGRLGIGSRGKLPQAGVYASRGICCLDKCQWLSPLECDWFTGLWLGSDTDCSSDPCDPDGLAGACCIGDDCELRTRIDCITAGGRFFGEGKSCEEIDCLEEIGGR